MTEASEEKIPEENEDVWVNDVSEKELDPPPFFKRWRSMYILVLGVWVALILLFYLFTKVYQ